MINTQEIIIRLLAALLFSGSVGLQRALTGKAAGMRTHILVGVGSALFTLISPYAFASAAPNADRIASQVVTGIGFIGGGAILKERGSIKGLTTAAGIWAAAALGVASGAGLYTMAAATTIIILATLIALRRIEVRFPRRALEAWVVRLSFSGDATLQSLYDALMTHCRKASLLELEQDENNQTCVVFAVELPHRFDIMALTAALRAAGGSRVAWHVGGNAAMEGGD